jgi:hypothetical protein
MANFVDGACIPANINLTVVNSASQGPVEVDTTIVARDGNGGNFDFTNVGNVSLTFDNGLNPPGNNSYQASPTSYTGSAASLKLKLEPVFFSTLFANLKANSGRLTVSATDGTTQVIAAAGSWTQTYAA